MDFHQHNTIQCLPTCMSSVAKQLHVPSDMITQTPKGNLKVDAVSEWTSHGHTCISLMATIKAA